MSPVDTAIVKSDGFTLELFCTNCGDEQGWRTGRRLSIYSILVTHRKRLAKSSTGPRWLT